MNTSIITNSLPHELIIKLAYYLDEKTLSYFTETCKFIKSFNFAKLILPSRIFSKIDDSFDINQMKITTLFCDVFNEYFMKSISYKLNIYLNKLVNIIDSITCNNINKRIRPSSNIIYSTFTPNRHQCIRTPNNKETHQFRIDDNYRNRRRMYVKQHSIMNISKVTYDYLRKKHFNVLALIY